MCVGSTQILCNLYEAPECAQILVPVRRTNPFHKLRGECIAYWLHWGTRSKAQLDELTLETSELAEYQPRGQIYTLTQSLRKQNIFAKV